MKLLNEKEFLAYVWPSRLLTHETLELRVRDRKADLIRRYFFTSPDDFLAEAKRHLQHDIYFGVSTRFGPSGKKQDCYRVQAVWVDFDGKKIEECQSLSPPPAILVDSGGGTHAYWLLKISALVRNHSSEIEAVNRGLAKRFGGDLMTCDVSRILRVGGTNHKYNPPRPVKAYLLNDRRYLLEDFKRLGIYEEKPDSSDIEISSGTVIKNLPPKVKAMLQTVGGNSHGGDFSRQDSAVVTSLLSHGLTPENVYATFAASARGRNAAERKAGHFDDYLVRTIRKALSFLGKERGNGENKIRVNFGRTRLVPDGDGILSQKASDVEVETPRWLWPSYLPQGKITVLAGDPGLGKSTISLDLVSRITRGTILPTGERCPTGTCLVVSAEDAAEDTIVPRLIASHANRTKVELMREVRIDDEILYLSFPRDFDRFRTKIIETGARLAIIDPLSAFLNKDTDSHKDQDIRSVLAPFEGIAEETQAAILIVAHLNKREESSAMYRVGGSIGIVGAARSVLMVSPVPNKDTRVLYSLKSNLSKRPPSLEYKTKTTTKEKGNGAGDWKGEDKVISSTIHWMGEIDFDPLSGAIAPQQRAEDTAEGFVRQLMEDGEVFVDDVFREAKMAGISKSQLNRVRESIGIRPLRKKGRWIWTFS